MATMGMPSGRIFRLEHNSIGVFLDLLVMG